MNTGAVWAVAVAAAVVAVPGRERLEAAPLQPAPTATATATPVGPPIDLSGRWSITRTYFKSCPRCGGSVIRTVPWVLTQSGADVRADRGPRGSVTGSGPAILTLEGIESEGFSVLRFWYASLHVAPDGASFEGAFNGSERSGNPCGGSPPEVTCFVSAGWIQGRRLDPLSPGPMPTPPVPSTSTPQPTATETPQPLVLPPWPEETPAEPTARAEPRPTALWLPWSSR